MSFQFSSLRIAILGVWSIQLITASAEIIRTDGGMPESLPKVPFELPLPEPQDSQDRPLKAEVLAKASARALFRGSYQFQSEGDMPRAIFLRTQAYKKDAALQGKLELAGWCAQAKDLDSAIYWLQQAALSDQLDEVMEDEALRPIRDDKRWAKLKPFLEVAEKAWKASSYWRTVLVVPAGHDASKPIPLLLTLHGMGSVPEDFADDPAYQELADELHIAVLGISGTKPEGMHRFVWKEKFEEDWKHIETVIAQLGKKVTPAKGKCLAMGFSQGAQLSAELAASHPDMFAGAIILSPGYIGLKRLPEALKAGGKAVAAEKFIVAYNSHEHPATVSASKSIVQQFQKVQAGVCSHAFSGDTHSTPPDLDEHLSLWVQFLLAGKL